VTRNRPVASLFKVVLRIEFSLHYREGCAVERAEDPLEDVGVLVYTAATRSIIAPLSAHYRGIASNLVGKDLPRIDARVRHWADIEQGFAKAAAARAGRMSRPSHTIRSRFARRGQLIDR